MAIKKGGIGRGLDSLIVKKDEGVVVADQSKESVFEADINKVEPNPNQPRKTFNEDELEDLTNSVKQFGIIQPLIVQDRKTYYEIIAGERRWRAAKKAGLKNVPVIVKNLTELEIAEISLLENLQRTDLNPIEEAMGYKRLIEEFHMKQDEVADKMSKSRTAITNAIRLLKLDPRVQEMVVDDKISSSHARAILGIEDLDKQFAFAERVFDEKLSVRDVEREVKRIANEKDNPPVEKTSKPSNIDPKYTAIYQDLEEKMKKKLGTKVSISPKDSKKGKIEIEYYSQDELDRIVKLIQSF